MSDTLIIGYGNPLRGDDGAGWHAVRDLQALLHEDNIRFLTLHQLGPELSELLSGTLSVIFIDGCIGERPGEISCMRLQPADTVEPLHHHLTPETLLSYTISLYGRVPYGILYTITGLSFGFDESLSPVVQENLHRLVEEVCSCVHGLESRLHGSAVA